MKLWSSFVKELKIAFRGFYFYIELFLAIILLFVLLFVVPENFDSKEVQYVYLDFPSASIEKAYTDMFDDLDGKPETVTLKAGKQEIATQLFETENSKIYVTETEEDMILLAKTKHKISASVVMNADDYEIHNTYYLQGNETARLKNLLLILHGSDDAALFDATEDQPVKSLGQSQPDLTDRENLLPAFLTFNGALMGFFIIAAYIFLDKKEGVIKAYAITPSPVWKYLLSKVLVLTSTMIVTSLIIAVPLMGTRINYLAMLLFLICTGLFASGLGLVIAGYYDDMVKSFGVMFLLMIGMMLPTLAYFSPSWDPTWLKFVPSYYIIFGFKEIFIRGDMLYVLVISLGYLAAGALLFAWAAARYRRTLSV